MIGRLSGTIEAIDEGTALIDVGGVGYLASCPARSLMRLRVGEAAVLWIETVVREDAIQLFGFLDRDERRLFRLLTTVQGVGPKAALAILGANAPEELYDAIASGDRNALTRAPGIGPRLAARVISELRDVVGGQSLRREGGVVVAAQSETAAPVTADAVSALVNLGFRPADAYAAVARVTVRLGREADLAALVRGSLAELAAKEQSG